VPEQLDAVIFDWGGTISVYAQLDVADVWRDAGRVLDPGREKELVERLVAAEAALWAGVSDTQASGTLPDLVRTAIAELELDVAEALLEEAAAHHLAAWTAYVEHDSEAERVLRSLRAAGFKTGLLSNTFWPGSFHDELLEADGLKDLFDARLYTSDMSFTKPHPSTFKAALEALSVEDPSRAVFVGDRPFDDIFGASRAGLRTILRPNPHVPPYDVEPDAVAHQLLDVLGIVAAWNRG
jgi:putative hydrolase of the HAD superfamily